VTRAMLRGGVPHARQGRSLPDSRRVWARSSQSALLCSLGCSCRPATLLLDFYAVPIDSAGPFFPSASASLPGVGSRPFQALPPFPLPFFPSLRAACSRQARTPLSSRALFPAAWRPLEATGPPSPLIGNPGCRARDGAAWTAQRVGGLLARFPPFSPTSPSRLFEVFLVAPARSCSRGPPPRSRFPDNEVLPYPVPGSHLFLHSVFSAGVTF